MSEYVDEYESEEYDASPGEESLLTTPQVMELLDITRMTIYKLRKEGRLIGYRKPVGRGVFYKRSNVIDAKNYLNSIERI